MAGGSNVVKPALGKKTRFAVYFYPPKDQQMPPINSVR